MSTAIIEGPFADDEWQVLSSQRILAVTYSEEGAKTIAAAFSMDWRVLGGVIPGPIPVEWVRVGDTIQDHGVTGTITRAVRTGGMVHLVIGSGHVSFAKVAQQDWIHVIEGGR